MSIISTPVSVTMSAVELKQVSPSRWVASWYDYTGEEYAHVTEGWIEKHFSALAVTGGGKWKATIREHGNGHYSAEVVRA